MRTTAFAALAALSITGFIPFVGAPPAGAQEGDGTEEATRVPSVRVLPPEIVRTLEISRIPTGRQTRMIVGGHWSCQNHSSGFEICRFKIVVCDDEDPGFCVEIP